MPLLIAQAQWLPASLCGSCAVVTYPLQRILSPQLFVGYQTTTSNQIVDRGNYGFGVMRIAVESENLVHNFAKSSPYLVFAALILAIACVVIALYRRRQGRSSLNFWIAATSLCAVCPVIAYPLRKRLAPKVFPDRGMTTAHSIANQVNHGSGVINAAMQVDHSLHHAAILIPCALQIIFVLAMIAQ